MGLFLIGGLNKLVPVKRSAALSVGAAITVLCSRVVLEGPRGLPLKLGEPHCLPEGTLGPRLSQVQQELELLYGTNGEWLAGIINWSWPSVPLDCASEWQCWAGAPVPARLPRAPPVPLPAGPYLPLGIAQMPTCYHAGSALGHRVGVLAEEMCV